MLGATLAKRVVGRSDVGVEAKLIGGRARLPIADGSLRMWHGSAHLVGFVGQGF